MNCIDEVSAVWWRHKHWKRLLCRSILIPVFPRAVILAEVTYAGEDCLHRMNHKAHFVLRWTSRTSPVSFSSFPSTFFCLSLLWLPSFFSSVCLSLFTKLVASAKFPRKTRPRAPSFPRVFDWWHCAKGRYGSLFSLFTELFFNFVWCSKIIK